MPTLNFSGCGPSFCDFCFREQSRAGAPYLLFLDSRWSLIGWSAIREPFAALFAPNGSLCGYSLHKEVEAQKAALPRKRRENNIESDFCPCFLHSYGKASMS